MKKIITHLNPDLDAVTCVWLIKRFLPGWEEAELGFVSAGQSTNKNPQADTDPDVLWVDVGLGKLDHHQTSEYFSAARLCLDHIRKKRKGQQLSPLEEEALEKIVEIVTEVDFAKDIHWEEISQDRYLFFLYSVIEGLGNLGKSDEEIIDFGLKALDAILLSLKHKIRAEEKLKEGTEFQTPWGKAIAIHSTSKDIMWQGQIQGYALVLGKDPKNGAARIYSRPDTKVDLTKAYEKIKKLDPKSDWFLHASKKLLLNQSSVSPDMRPTKLSLKQIIEVLQG